MKKFLGFILMHPIKEDFVLGLKSNEMGYLLAYSPTPGDAKIFKDFNEIEDFVLQLDSFDFDVVKLFDADDQYLVYFETTVSSSPVSR